MKSELHDQKIPKMLEFAEIWSLVISFVSWLLYHTTITKKIVSFTKELIDGYNSSLSVEPSATQSPSHPAIPQPNKATVKHPPNLVCSLKGSCRPGAGINGSGAAVPTGASDKKRPARLVIPVLRPDALGSPPFGSVQECQEEKLSVGVEERHFAVISKKGRRRTMEDSYKIITDVGGDPKQALFGVFDGHGGRGAVDFVTERLGKSIVSAIDNLQIKIKEDDSMEAAIKKCYVTTDEELRSQGVSGGACVATVLVNNRNLYVANVGDCRVVLSRNGTAFPLTRDHRLDVDDERVRIENAGGYVDCIHGVWRVQGSLSVSRSMGDMNLKEWVICEPEITKIDLSSDTDFLIMASDGLWDKVSNQEAVAEVVKNNKNTFESCRKLVDLASWRGNKDDITVMVIDLAKFR